jgi:hypothetical protein
MRYRVVPMDSPARRKLEEITAALAPPEAVEDDGWIMIFSGLSARRLDGLLEAAGIADSVEAEPAEG